MNKINYKNKSTHYLESRMMQVFHITPFLEILKKYKNFSRAIEVGTAYGGFTNLLADYFDEVYTFDIKNLKPNFYDHKNIKQITTNLHERDEIENKVLPIISQQGSNIIFVDGGNKALEANLLADYIKSNDLILCHDFSINEQDFQNRGKIIWNCSECFEKDLNLKNLKRSELFEIGLNFAWGVYERNI